MSHKHNPKENIFACRLKEARQRMRLSQKQLGIIAGIDEFVASTRINRYEQGVHEPDVKTAGNLAKVLKVPLAYLFAEDYQLAMIILEFTLLNQEKIAERANTAELLLLWEQLSKMEKKKVLSYMHNMIKK